MRSPCGEARTSWVIPRCAGSRYTCTTHYASVSPCRLCMPGVGHGMMALQWYVRQARFVTMFGARRFDRGFAPSHVAWPGRA